MKLVANECANCHRPVGYIVQGCLALPTFCILCASDRETMTEWGHRLDPREKPLIDVLLDYRSVLNLRDLPRP